MALWPFKKRKNRLGKQAVGASSSLSAQLASLSRTAKSESSIVNPHETPHTSTTKTHRRDSKRRKNGREQAPVGSENSCVPPRQIVTPSPMHPVDLGTSPPSFLSRHDRWGSPTSRIFSSSKLHVGINMSQHSLVRSINEVPTLRNSRTESTGLLRRKSSKRKRNDHAREQEIKSMSIDGSWELLSAKSRASGVHHTRYDQPRSFSPDSQAYKLSMLDALSPRPTLRYAQAPRYVASPEPFRLSTSKGKDRAIQIGEFNSRERINELADDMDAGTLRELMERDRRRRAARKRASQNTKPEQSSEESQKLPVDPHRTSAAQAVDTHMVDQKPDEIGSSRSPNQSDTWLQDPSKDHLVHDVGTQQKANTQGSNSIGGDEKSFVHVSAADATPASKRGSLSQLPEQGMASVSDISRTQLSEKRLSSNAGRIGRSLSSFFRRGSRFGRESRRKVESPSFSVPSRESFSRISHSETAGMPAVIPKKSSTRFDGQSIRSRFTEHFDDPIADMRSAPIDIYPVPNRLSNCTGKATVTTAATEAQDACRASGANSPDTRPNSTFLAHSLASIDSEASWLSGKPSRRLSQAWLSQYRGNGESKEDQSESPEDRAASDEPLGPPAAVPEEEEEEFNVVQDDMAKPPEDEGTTWHKSIGKRAHVVSPGTRAKSREGLFAEFLDCAGEMTTPEEDSPLEFEGDVEVRRATSVDLGKNHARRISAGSAKLLDIPPRSCDDRRPSSGTISSGVLPVTSERPNGADLTES